VIKLFHDIHDFFKSLKRINLHKIIKNIVFTSCFIISVFLINQLVSYLLINTNTKIKIFIAIVIESSAMIAFLEGKLSWIKSYSIKGWRKIKYILPAILLFFIYGSYAFIAINSAIGYFSMELNQQKDIYQKIDKISRLDEREYNQNAYQIDMYQIQYDQETDKYGKKSKELEKNIKDLKIEQRKLRKNLDKTPKITENNSKNIIECLDDIYPVSENTLKIIIFGIIVFIVYAGQIITAPNLPDDDDKDNNSNNTKDNVVELNPFQQKLITYVNGLFEGRKANGTKKDERLNGDPVVSQKTGIPESECNELREYLKKLKVNGGMALRSGQGGTYANYSKEKIIKYVKTHELKEII
jgi:hypothetical protein